MDNMVFADSKYLFRVCQECVLRIGFCFQNRGHSSNVQDRNHANALEQASGPSHTIIPALSLKMESLCSFGLMEGLISAAGTCPDSKEYCGDFGMNLQERRAPRMRHSGKFSAYRICDDWMVVRSTLKVDLTRSFPRNSGKWGTEFLLQVAILCGYQAMKLIWKSGLFRCFLESRKMGTSSRLLDFHR